jgi:hypothetical protein
MAKHTLIATIFSYSSLLFPVIILVALYYLLENGRINLSTPPIETQRVIILFLWTILSTNPFTAAFITEIMLEEEQSLFLIYPPDFSLVLFSPWILYVVFSVTMTALMIWLIVFYLNRYER